MSQFKREEYFKNVEEKGAISDGMVKFFWSEIREHKIDKEDFDFTGYAFPRFQHNKIKSNADGEDVFEEDCNFWKKGDKLEFKTEVKFNNCVFAGEALFGGVKFHENGWFQGARFIDHAIFSLCIFSKSAIFRNAVFEKFLEMMSCNFLSKSGFQFCVFQYDVDMSRVRFEKSPNFRKAEFQRKVTFARSIFFEEMPFHPDNFSDKYYSKLVELNKPHSDTDIVPIPKLEFRNIVFSDKVEIYDVDLSQSTFSLCDVTKLRLSECIYVKNTHRLILYDEKREFDSGENKSLKYSRSEELYRQLKRNFDNEKNWELAGKAYRSQMLMRQKAIGQDIRKKRGFTTAVFDWIIYLIYRSFSGFTQSYLRPLFLLLFVNVAIFPFYYCHYEMNSFTDGIRKSLNASLPYLKIDIGTLTYNVWWVKSLETLISTILLAFFIIAIRKRFK